MRRVLMVLAAVALMVAMMAASPVPAFAKQVYTCTQGDDSTRAIGKIEARNLEVIGFECTKTKPRDI
jgi:hypothetical protein